MFVILVLRSSDHNRIFRDVKKYLELGRSTTELLLFGIHVSKVFLFVETRAALKYRNSSVIG